MERVTIPISKIKRSLSEYQVKGFNGKHKIYSIPCSTLAAMSTSGQIVQWKYNRPYSQERVDEISKIIEEEQYVGDTIKLALIKGDKVLSCYDGNHRRLAIKSSFSFHVLIDIMWDATEEIVHQAFFDVNQAVSVPELYTEVELKDIQGTVANFVADFVKDYSGCLSTKVNCYRPHFERDTFTKNITDCWESLGKPDIDQLLLAITSLNDDYVNGKKKYYGLKPNVEEKCRKNGLWLFAKNKGINPEDLHPYLQ